METIISEVSMSSILIRFFIPKISFRDRPYSRVSRPSYTKTRTPNLKKLGITYLYLYATTILLYDIQRFKTR